MPSGPLLMLCGSQELGASIARERGWRNAGGNRWKDHNDRIVQVVSSAGALAEFPRNTDIFFEHDWWKIEGVSAVVHTGRFHTVNA